MKKNRTLVVLMFAGALLWSSSASFAHAQTYGGSAYGSGPYSEEAASTPSSSGSSSGGGGVISGPLSPGYVNTANGTSTHTSSFYKSFLNVFNRNLTYGNEGQDVKMLQKLLNAEGFVVATLGAGASGFESTYFGGRTLQALVRFQNAHAVEILKPVGLTVGSGYFGPSTRAFLAKYLLGK